LAWAGERALLRRRKTPSKSGNIFNPTLAHNPARALAWEDSQIFLPSQILPPVASNTRQLVSNDLFTTDHTLH
jgi:hypothetical protein